MLRIILKEDSSHTEYVHQTTLQELRSEIQKI